MEGGEKIVGGWPWAVGWKSGARVSGGNFFAIVLKMQWIAAGVSIFSTCYLLPATCYLLPATCYLLPATCYLLPARNWSDRFRKESGSVGLSCFVCAVFLYKMVFVVLSCLLLRNSLLFRWFV